MDLREIEGKLLEIKPIHSIHHTHIWSLDGEQHVLTTHIVVPKDTPRSSILDVKHQIRHLAEQQKLFHITVEVEFQDEDCLMARCNCSSLASSQMLQGKESG